MFLHKSRFPYPELTLPKILFIVLAPLFITLALTCKASDIPNLMSSPGQPDFYSYLLSFFLLFLSCPLSSPSSSYPLFSHSCSLPTPPTPLLLLLCPSFFISLPLYLAPLTFHLMLCGQYCFCLPLAPSTPHSTLELLNCCFSSAPTCQW